jgi:hypothetical protein
MTNDCARLLAFYDGSGVDSRGRTIEQVLAFPFATMEASHDYIQWLFPLDVPSGVTPDAPLVGTDCQRFFAGDPTRAIMLRRAFERMLDFYGLLANYGNAPQVVKAKDFNERAANWLTPGNHNFLRLTRIMKSLVLLGHSEQASALFRCLEQIYSEHSAVIGSTTFSYWRNAVSGRS